MNESEQVREIFMARRNSGCDRNKYNLLSPSLYKELLAEVKRQKPIKQLLMAVIEEPIPQQKGYQRQITMKQKLQSAQTSTTTEELLQKQLEMLQKQVAATELGNRMRLYDSMKTPIGKLLAIFG